MRVRLAVGTCERALEVLAGNDPELREHLPQVPFDGARR